MTCWRSRHRARLLLIGLAAAVPVACASEVTSPATASVTATSLANTTEPATTSAAHTTTTTTPRVDAHFEPACHDQVNERDPAGASDDPAFETLTVVGDHPALDIGLPTAVSGDNAATGAPIAGAVRIPGGLLVTIAAPSTGWFPGGMVAAVDLDGVVRWVRCIRDGLTGPVVAPLEANPDRVLLGTSRSDGGTISYSWDVVSLADGNTLGSLDDLVADARLRDAAASNRQLILAERGVAVFAPQSDHVFDVSVDGLLRVDLDTWTLSTTTVPPEFDGHPAGELQLALGTDGSLLRMGHLLDSQLRVPQSVEVNGTWNTDENLRRSVWGPVVDAWYDGPPRLASWDATGVVRWSSDIRFPGREGFMYGRSGDVEVAVSCGPADDVSPCPDERLVGVDAETGGELWSLPGWRIVGPMNDGIAYVTDSVDVMVGEQPTGWFILDTQTGRLADGPSWSGLETFRTGCCGEYDYQHTAVLGGILVAVSGQTMRVWFPATLTPATTTTVTLV